MAVGMYLHGRKCAAWVALGMGADIWEQTIGGVSLNMVVIINLWKVNIMLTCNDNYLIRSGSISCKRIPTEPRE